jgi:hypothetical protein
MTQKPSRGVAELSPHEMTHLGNVSTTESKKFAEEDDLNSKKKIAVRFSTKGKTPDESLIQEASFDQNIQQQ